MINSQNHGKWVNPLQIAIFNSSISHYQMAKPVILINDLTSPTNQIEIPLHPYRIILGQTVIRDRYGLFNHTSILVKIFDNSILCPILRLFRLNNPRNHGRYQKITHVLNHLGCCLLLVGCWDYMDYCHFKKGNTLYDRLDTLPSCFIFGEMIMDVGSRVVLHH